MDHVQLKSHAHPHAHATAQGMCADGCSRSALILAHPRALNTVVIPSSQAVAARRHRRSQGGAARPRTQRAGAAAAAGLQQRDLGAQLAVCQGGVPPAARHLCTSGGPHRVVRGPGGAAWARGTRPAGARRAAGRVAARG